MARPDWATPDALSVSTLLHVGDDADRFSWARDLMRPHVIVFLDEPSWLAAGIDVRQQPHHVPDPHRPQQVYEGFWGVTASGTVVGKAPQHPTTHRLYRADDMDRYLRSVPLDPRPPAQPTRIG